MALRSARSLVLLVLLTGVGAAQSPRVAGVRAGSFTFDGAPPLLMPTHVAVDEAGRVFVADGVSDRVLQFAPDGALRDIITHVAGQPLRRPMSVHIGPDRRLWITDTGNQRVALWSGDPAAQAQIDLQPAVDAGLPLDITDAVPAVDPDIVWLVNNDAHRVIRFNHVTGETRTLGGRGTNLGAFDYPFMLATSAGGDAVVSDVINGRVVLLNDQLQVVRALSHYGVRIGELYRPKGVAIDPRGWVWVADSDLGAVQVFKATGGFVGVLRNPDGTPLKFSGPTGLAFGPGGDLYVAELEADRITRITLTIDAEAPADGPVARAPLISEQPRNCTACHIEWMEPLVKGQSTELIDVPPDSADYPYVSRAEVCLSCHDGSVDDSRRRVWLEHGHQTGVEPPAQMVANANLPLVENQVVCRTCHSAHTRGGAGDVLAEAVFLRVEKSPAELCNACHTGFDTGIVSGMHPVGEMEIALPSSLQGEHTGAVDPDFVTCLGCHTGHGAPETNLLKLSLQDNSACLTCHTQLRPELFEADAMRGHAATPRLTTDQRDMVAQFDARVGDDQQMLCVSCHVTHNAPHAQHLLAFDPAGEETCLGCHSSQQAVVDSPHDIQQVAPNFTNRFGTPASEAGSCRSCHTAHQYALEQRPSALDQTGKCLACHAEGLANASMLGSANHPETNCTDCHDPHNNATKPFLIARPEDHCVTCHTDYAGLRQSGPHQMQSGSEAWPAASLETEDACLACHRPHGTEQTGLRRVPPPVELDAVGESCLGCHADVRPGGDHTAMHPQGIAVPADAELVRAAGDYQSSTVTCRTCHDPHASGAASDVLLRIEPDQHSVELCYDCHSDMRAITAGGHSPLQMERHGLPSDHCLPCHENHGAPQEVAARYLWPDPLHTHLEGLPEVDAKCMACHEPQGVAPTPRAYEHPEVVIFNPYEREKAGYLPLYDQAGYLVQNGEIGCKTCHLPHGRETAADDIASQQAEGAALLELKAKKLHLRPFVEPNVCTTCHGEDALRRFMYYHDPQRRGGSIDQGR